jgi:hypothetical protein
MSALAVDIFARNTHRQNHASVMSIHGTALQQLKRMSNEDHAKAFDLSLRFAMTVAALVKGEN